MKITKVDKFIVKSKESFDDKKILFTLHKKIIYSL